MSSGISKHITFPPALLEKIKTNANAFGVSFAEYLRHLAINDVIHKTEEQKRKEWADSLTVYHATEEESERWNKARQEEGIKMTSEELSKYLKNV